MLFFQRACLEWEALLGIPHPALCVRRSDCHVATLTSLDRSLAIAIIRLSPGLRSWRGFRAAGRPPATALSGDPCRARGGSGIGRDLRIQSLRYKLLPRTPIPPGDQDGLDRPLMDETTQKIEHMKNKSSDLAKFIHNFGQPLEKPRDSKYFQLR